MAYFSAHPVRGTAMKAFLVLLVCVPALAESPLMNQLQELEKARLASASPVYAVSCQRPPAAPSAPARVVASTGELPFKLEQAGYYLKDVLSLLAMTESGKDATQRFKSRYESGDIKTE